MVLLEASNLILVGIVAVVIIIIIVMNKLVMDKHINRIKVIHQLVLMVMVILTMI